MKREYTLEDMFLEIFTHMIHGTYDPPSSEADLNTLIANLVHDHERRKCA